MPAAESRTAPARAVGLRQSIDLPESLWLAEARIDVAVAMLNDGEPTKFANLLEPASQALSMALLLQIVIEIDCESHRTVCARAQISHAHLRDEGMTLISAPG